MPPVLLLLIAGAGAYAGLKWIAREAAKQAERTEQAAKEMRCRAGEGSGAPDDRGALEFDPQEQVYRPRG